MLIGDTSKIELELGCVGFSNRSEEQDAVEFEKLLFGLFSTIISSSFPFPPAFFTQKNVFFTVKAVI